MRKFYLFFTGLLFAGVSVFAQPDLNDPRNAKVIFQQNFEAQEGLTDAESYIQWSTTPIDTITELEYYSKLGNSTPRGSTGDIYDGSADWEIFAVRTDSVSSEHPEVSYGVGIVLFNGVSVSSNKSEIANGVYDRDSYTIVNDGGEDAARIDAFEQYGEDGGKSYFKYITGQIDSRYTSHYTASTHSIGKYRRNLYVRGLDIEDESSYRLTFYIKTQKQNSWGPIFYADLMRGYHHQRAPFSMGYKSGKDFSYTMDEFEDGKWQKVTIMNYYLNDHEADAYPIYKGDYNWTDDWCWRPTDEQLAAIGKTLPEGEVLNYIKQPDKFFVRFSFATDSVEYSLDNLSLTKSWIAGCEYYRDIVRIDFGYQTNLSDLVAAEKARTNIPVVDIPFDYDTYNYEVWGLKKGGDPNNTGDPNDPDDTGDWVEVYIRSAEYHEDGYMYMFTDYNQLSDGTLQPILFGDYDKVLVTFRNPEDPNMTLKYTGSLYPKALDTEWVEAGKIVPDFYNEIATPNPNIAKNVYSKDALPPIMMKAPFEEGAFGLDGSIKELKFKFSKEVMVDNDGIASERVVATVGNEVWKPTWSEEDQCLVITRPTGKTDLAGDYEIKIIQIKDKSGKEGDPVILHYHFGYFDKNPQEAAKLYGSDWRNDLGDNKNTNECVPSTTWIRDCNSGSKPVFTKGTNGSVDDISVDGKKAKCCLFLLGYDLDNLDNCAYYISSRQSSGSYTGHMWSIVDFAAPGNYIIKFKSVGYISTKAENCIKFYPKPDVDESLITFADFENVADKQTLGDIQPTVFMSKTDAKSGTATWPVGTETYDFEFSVPAAGKYVFEWVSKKGSSSGDGVLIGNYSITTKGSDDLSVKYVKKLLETVGTAKTIISEVTDAKYKGANYTALATAISEGEQYEGNFPSQYDAMVAYVNGCISTMNQRIDTVNLYDATVADVTAKLAELTGDSVNLDVYKALKNHLNANANMVYSEKSNADLAAEVTAYKDEMTAIDNRLALMDQFSKKIAETKALIDAADARKDYAEYAVMERGYDVALKAETITSSDDELTASLNALVEAKNGYLFKFDYYIAKTRQIKELYALADKLGYDFAGFGGNKDSVKAVIDALEDDEPALSAVLRQAAILQINKAYAENDPETIEKLLGLDVSPLIPNYFFYNEAQVDRDMQKNSSGNWIVKLKANTTAIPGWTFTPSSGNWYFVNTNIKDDFVMGDYMDWETDGHTFIGGLRSATNTKGIITADIKDLPEGYYKVGMFAYNQTGDLAFEYKTDSVTYDGKVNVVMNGGSKFNYKEVGIDSVLVAGNLTYTINQKSNSSSEFELRNAVLRLGGINPECNYAAVVTAQEATLNQMITIVDAPVQKVANVQYYNLGGMQVGAPKSGEILIRKTIQGGKVVVDKVMIK